MMDTWQNCYDDGWKDIIIPEAFSHPAKFSRGLIHRIYWHAKEMGWVKPGDWVLDPFGGVALGGLDAMSMGLNWIGVELEPKFCKLGEQNIDLWRRTLTGWPNLGTARIVQGDSRSLKRYISTINLTDNFIGAPDLVVSSPPFIDSIGTKDQKFWDDHNDRQSNWHGATRVIADYGHTPGNLANMKEGDIDLVVSSPPFPFSDDTGKRDYGETIGNLGGTSGDTFWTASKEIISQCYDLLKPTGMSIWVCKDYIKKGKRVPFSDRWLSLCESVGFTLVCRHQAMLVKEHGTQTTIHGDKKITTERKSFFRRLAESKGSPRIDEEDVLCLVKI